MDHDAGEPAAVPSMSEPRRDETRTGYGAGYTDGSAQPSQVSILRLVNTALERRKLLMSIPIALSAFTLLISMLWPKSYTATAMLAPEQSTPAPGGQILSLASQFGVSLGSSVNSAGFYAKVLGSDNILAQVLLTHYAHPAKSPGGSDSMLLMEYYVSRRGTRPDSLQHALDALRGHLTIEADDATGIVTVSVDTRNPHLSASVVRRFIAVIDSFNTVVRQTSARARRAFLESRVAVTYDSLLAAQGRMEDFLEGNLTWRSSPRLVAQHERLALDQELKTEVYQSIVSQFEDARIDEINDTPVLTVVSPPLLPTIPSSPRPLLFVVIAFVVGCVVGLALAVMQEYARSLRDLGDPEYLHARVLWKQVGMSARDRVRRVLRL